MFSPHSNSIVHPKQNSEYLVNGTMPVQSPQSTSTQQLQYPQKTQEFSMDKYSQQNFRTNAIIPPPPNESASIGPLSGTLPPPMYRQQQQQQNAPLSAIMNNSIVNGGGGDASAHSSRTASPALNKSVHQSSSINSPMPTTTATTISNQLNNTNMNISNDSSPRNNFPLYPPPPQSNSSFNQQQKFIGTTNSSPSLLSSSMIGGGMKPSMSNTFQQNASNLSDSMRNLSVDQNNITTTNAATTNGFQMQPSVVSSSNNYSNNFQVNNFKTSALSNQQPLQHQQQQQQQLQSLDNHSYYKNALPSDNALSSVNKINNHVPMYQQQSQMIATQSPGTPVLANCENRNTMISTPSSRNDNTHLNSHPLPPPSTTSSFHSLSSTSQHQPMTNNSHLTNDLQHNHQQPGISSLPPLNASAMMPSSVQQQALRRPMYPPSVSQQHQQIQSYDSYQHQQQQQYQQQQQQLRNMPQPPLSSARATPPPPTFAGQPNYGQLKYPSAQPEATSQQSYGNYPSVTRQGFNKLWGQDVVDLMQQRHILPHEKVQPPRIVLNNQFYESVNCNPDIMRCTLTRIPESNNLLQKSRLPLGILVHPFRDINSLPVIQCPNIVRCRVCRAYINPFVYFVDSKMWKCNLCYRVNELPEDFQYDPATKTYGDVTRRPEVRSSTIEFIAPSEYMLRPPQPAIYLFMFDVSILAQQSGYLETACSTLLKYLDDMPGDARASIGFIAFNSEIHFYNIADGFSQPHEMTLVDIDDPFLPRPDNLLVNLKENKELIKDLLTQLPTRFEHSHDPGSALGAALQVAYKLMSATGGRVTVFQTCLPTKGAGALQPREDPNNRSSKDVMHLNPATDFYKRHALECSGFQIAVDLFVLNQQYCDLATISGVSKYSGGSIYHFPLYQKTKPQHIDALKQCLKRYLTRKIGFEAVMRIRCTRGLQVHTFHGNFFVRSTDLLSLPNVNPDAGYGMQISYEETLTDIKTICFQSALLYTNSEGERRIRVHTLCLPVTTSLSEVMHSADSQAIVSLLSKMAVDRCMSSSVSDARDAFINATIDVITAFKTAQNLPQGQNGQLLISKNLSLLPLYISALLKHVAFRIGTSTRLDDRVAAMDAMKILPLDQLMKTIYPEYYILDSLFTSLNDDSNEGVGDNNTGTTDEIDDLHMPPLLQLSAEFIDSRSMFLIDSGPLIIIYVGLNVPVNILENVLGVQNTSEIPDYCYGLQPLNTPENTALRKFIDILNEDKPFLPTIQIIRDTSTCRNIFIEKLVDDRSESSLSYYEFLQHLRSQIK